MEQPTIFTLDGTQYDIESIPEDARNLFTDIGTIDQKLQEKQTDIGIIKIAKESLLGKFRGYTSQFKEHVEKPAPKKRAPRKPRAKKTTEA